MFSFFVFFNICGIGHCLEVVFASCELSMSQSCCGRFSDFSNRNAGNVSVFFFQSVPKPIALEPCFGNKAAVLSIFVRLPRGTGGIPPPGQSGKMLLAREGGREERGGGGRGLSHTEMPEREQMDGALW